MKKKLSVVVQCRFAATHAWPEAPPGVGYLRNEHRHEFHVQVRLPVNHVDRDVEFLTFKKELEDYIAEVFERKNLGRTSCETIAEQIASRFIHYRPVEVEVWEDGENGAILELDYQD